MLVLIFINNLLLFYFCFGFLRVFNIVIIFFLRIVSINYFNDISTNIYISDTIFSIITLLERSRLFQFNVHFLISKENKKIIKNNIQIRMYC